MHTHLEQWAADIVAPGEQLGVRCLAQGSHLSCGHFLPEPGSIVICILAMHITNQKLSFDIFTVGNVLNIFMQHDLNILMNFGTQ